MFTQALCYLNHEQFMVEQNQWHYIKYYYMSFPLTVIRRYYVNLALRLTTHEFSSHDGQCYLNGNVLMKITSVYNISICMYVLFSMVS